MSCAPEMVKVRSGLVLVHDRVAVRSTKPVGSCIAVSVVIGTTSAAKANALRSVAVVMVP